MVQFSVYVFNLTDDGGWLNNKQWGIVHKSIHAMLTNYNVKLISPLSHGDYLTGFIGETTPDELTNIDNSLRALAKSVGLSQAFTLTEI